MTTTKQLGDKIALNDKERAFARRRPSKRVFVAVIPFRGPRGRVYRSTRTEAKLTAELAAKSAAEIAARPYAHGAFPLKATVYECDALGRITQVIA